ncbi:MAG: CTP synthase [Candidatus Micrarchaeota archaeon]
MSLNSNRNGSIDTPKTRYICVTGGVISGLGKGVVASAIGRILKSRGYTVTGVKIDPYINMDAGTMRPTEHGEVFVTYDGGETDQDLGNYERFLDEELSRNNSITTGQVYAKVIADERDLKYEGKCVEVIPHIPMEVQSRIEKCAKEKNADFVIIEVGGTIGDYQNVLFIEALKKMYLEGKPVVFVHLVYLLVPHNLGEMKTKPAQHSVRQLNELGIFPDFVICRSEKPMDEVRKQKISLFCNVRQDEIISAHDLETIYEEPLLFEEQGLGDKILAKFEIKNPPKSQLEDWKKMVHQIKAAERTVNIGIVGKYFDSGNFTLEDSYVSVIEAIKHAAFRENHKPKIHWIDAKQFEPKTAALETLSHFDGIIVPGGFGASGVEGKINAIEYCRENKIPYLGLCYGMQLAVVEYGRHVAGMSDAHSTEINPNTTYPVIDILPEQRKLIEQNKYGNTMRLGNYTANLKKGTLVHKLYGQDKIVERHRHRFEVNRFYEDALEKAGLVISGKNTEADLVEFIELANHPFFVGTQSHPEFKSRPLSPHPLFLGFVKAAIEKQHETANQKSALR